jgi:hypothetical protein
VVTITDLTLKWGTPHFLSVLVLVDLRADAARKAREPATTPFSDAMSHRGRHVVGDRDVTRLRRRVLGATHP